MVRPKKIRRIFFQPDVTYFKPAGIPIKSLKETVLSFDELEALRLVDLEGMEQHAAGQRMKISQSTLSRLLKSGRKKLADAIINGHAIKIQGGSFKIVQSRKNGLQRGWDRGSRERGRARMTGLLTAGPGGICKCPECGYEEAKVRGQPCMTKKCPKCQTLMKRA